MKDLLEQWKVVGIAVAGLIMGLTSIITINQKASDRFTGTEWKQEKTLLLQEIKSNRTAIDALVLIITRFSEDGPKKVRDELIEIEGIQRQQLRQERVNEGKLDEIIDQLKELEE